MSSQQELKDQAIAYYQENKVPLRMQDVLNVMFKQNPIDANGYVSTYFEKFAITPTISKTVSIPLIDSKGQPSLSTKVYCAVKNEETLVAQSNISIDTTLPDSAKPEEKDAEDLLRQAEINESMRIICEEFSELLAACDPCQQQSIDEQIYLHIESKRLKIAAEDAAALADNETSSPQATADDTAKKAGKKSAKGSAKKKGAQVIVVPDDPIEKPYPGWHAVTAVSQAVSLAGAQLQRKSVFDHLMISFGCDGNTTKLPLPMITLIQGGKAALGKSNCVKEYIIVPHHDMPVATAVTHAAKIHDNIVKVLSVKVGSAIKNLSDSGAICPVLDKPEQGFDMINEAATSLGLEMGKDFFYIINASAQEVFDYDKGKYEVVSGVSKGPDDMADFWADLVNRYPAIIGIIDPIRCEEKPQWNSICSTISEKCLIISSQGSSRPALLKDKELDFTEFSTSGIVMRLDKCNTLTSIMECSKKMRELDNVIILATGRHETNDTTVVDLSIACQARFLKLGAPVRGEQTAKYNKLIEYESEYQDRLSKWEQIEFLSLPPNQPTEQEDETTEDQEKSVKDNTEITP